MVKYYLTLLGKHLNGTKTSCFAVAITASLGSRNGVACQKKHNSRMDNDLRCPKTIFLEAGVLPFTTRVFAS